MCMCLCLYTCVPLLSPTHSQPLLGVVCFQTCGVQIIALCGAAAADCRVVSPHPPGTIRQSMEAWAEVLLSWNHRTTCTHTQTHTHAHTCTHMHTHAHTCTHMHTHARTCTHCPLLLQSWPPESYAKHVRSIASYLKTAISEADSVVRATSRKTYWQLHAAFPEVATK